VRKDRHPRVPAVSDPFVGDRDAAYDRQNDAGGLLDDQVEQQFVLILP
jgi:hypothetical protein